MLTQWSVVHTVSLRDEKMIKEMLGLVPPRPGEAIQLYRESRGSQTLSSGEHGEGRSLRPSTRRKRSQRWSFRSLFAR